MLLLIASVTFADESSSAPQHPQRNVHPAVSDSFPTGARAAAPPALSKSPLLSTEALSHPLTQRYITQYSSAGGIAWLKAVMEKGGIYIPFIRDEIAKRGLPAELLYLPVIESGDMGSAKSKSGAAGLWQFMLNSIAPYGMKAGELLDERRDFQKSTIAALRKLEENHRILGNWPLALAAYNAGLGAANSAVKRGGTSDYWLLCEKKLFRSETIQYVPQLLAVAYILSQPRRFGLDYWPQTVEWTAVPAPKQASLRLLADQTGIDYELLRLLNMELVQGITPPPSGAGSAYRLKVPAAAVPLVEEVFSQKDLKLLQFYPYKVQYGDTLSALSRHYGISLSLIEKHNPGILDRYLKPGEMLNIPALKDVPPYRSVSASQPAHTSQTDFSGVHQVKKGETLWSLAIRYGIAPQLLAAGNGMDLNQILPEGKVLKVPIIEP
jgi:membrane-bound lytic murein transglycosylase D